MGDFTKGFKEAQNSVEGLERGTRGAGITIGKLAAAVGITYAVAKGFQAMKASVDGAISRYDTLNNFPRVLEQIGFGAEESENAINKLSDGIQGLPTTLDDVASTAQRIAVLTGNLEGATDTTLALNNAFIASGADAANASRGLDQYVQMLSKGEVDLQSWRTLQETMGVALNDVAKAFGFAGTSAQNDLYDALKSGNITFDEFNSKLIELNEGTNGFAERALTASGGIRTAWTNMQTAIVRGVTNIISAIDSVLANTSFGSIENIIAKIGNAFFKMLDTVSGAIPTIFGAFQRIRDVLSPSVPLILGIVAAIATFATGIAIINSVQRAFVTLKIAAAAVNAVMMANPIMLIIAALTGLAVAIAYAYKNFESFRNVVDLVFSSIMTVVQPAIDAVVSFIMEKVEFLRGWWNEVWPSLKDAFVNIWTGILAVAQPILMGIVALFQFVWPFVQMLVVSVWSNIKGVIDGALKIITGIVQAFAALFTGNWSALWEAVKQIFSGALQLVWNLVQLWFVGRILKVGTVFAKGLQTVLRGMWNAIRGVFQSGVSVARNVVSAGFNFIRSLITAVMNGIRSVISGVWNAIRAIISGVVNGIRSVITGGFNAARSVVTSVSNAIRSVVSSVFNSLVGIVRSAITRVPSAISSGMGAALRVVTGFASRFLAAGRNIVTSIARGITSAIGSVTSAISSVTTRIRNFLPFSPAKEGPLRDIHRLNFGGTIAQSIKRAVPIVQRQMANLVAVPDLNIGGQVASINRMATRQLQTSVTSELSVSRQPIIVNIYDNKEAVRAYVNEHNAIDAQIRRF